MGQRDRQRLGVLAGEHRAGGLDGHRNRHRQPPAGLGEGALDRQDAGLDVAGVLAGLEQQVVGAAGHQTQRLHPVVLLQLLEGHPAGDRDRLGRRPIEPQTKRGRPGSSKRAQACARQLGRTRLISKARSSRPYSASTSGVRRRCWSRRCRRPPPGSPSAARVDHVGARQTEILVAAVELGAAEVLGGQIERPAAPVPVAPSRHQQALVERLDERRGAFVGIRARR